MCGINGLNWEDKKIISRMNSSLIHRGPDSRDFFTDKNISLGHTRLSIIDLSKKGNQPMIYSHEKKKVAVVFNGEIYNFQEIKEELRKKGYKFKNKTDTEVLLASYFEYGEECVNKFNGMWAFCIYDLNKKTLFLSRDRFGKKPLYYFFDKEKFIFSSEIKGILKTNLKPKLNKKAIDSYLYLGFIPAPQTIYENVFKLEASQNLVYDLKSHKLKKYFYYSLPKYSPIHDKKKLIEEGKKLLEESTRMRLISDVPLGAFLSGGIDSSTVVSQMTNFVNMKKLNTFSIGFKDGFDESKYSKLMKDFLKTKHNHEYFKENNFKRLLDGEIFYFYDEPFSEYSMFPSFNLSKLARKNVTVALSGDGGDEIFGGYPRYKIAKQLILLRKIPVSFRRVILKILNNLYPTITSSLKEGFNLSLFPLEDFYAESRPELYKPPSVKKILKEKMKKALDLSRGDLVEAVRLMDILFYTLPDRFLLNVDRASMSQSLEVRCPFLDYRLVEYSSKIPSKWKSSAFNTRVIMKSILKNIIPPEILNRKKKGFTPPIIEWASKKEYSTKIDLAFEELSKKNIISEDWQNFYKKILKKKDENSMRFKIRLLFLWRWYKLWE